ncbi:MULTISPECIES: HAD family hydrolase [unclassified Streptomyces]|uniref:HAD family hydrolase n=1 Tax=unclassified Streptomyces TaxID=2593676 RepID=UPI0025558E8C|nr:MULTISPECIES: HAD family phosphatase [unclassified Streptomyces]WRZ66256.1 HAD family phosphatase [Streptomyces sp. NBC_01257]
MLSPVAAPVRDEAQAVRRARNLLARAQCLVWDFDGPMVRLFVSEQGSGDSEAHLIADELIGIAAQHGPVPDEVRGNPDPHGVFRRYDRLAHRPGATERARAIVVEMRHALTARELKAAEHATPTPGADRLVRAWHALGRGLAVASNNHADAVRRYLERTSLDRYFGGAPVIGRCDADTRRMKPDPWVLNGVVAATGLGVDGHVMIGDSTADLGAAGAIGMPFIGYHRDRAGRDALTAAGARTVVGSMAVLADAAEALSAQVR